MISKIAVKISKCIKINVFLEIFIKKTLNENFLNDEKRNVSHVSETQSENLGC
jgi:hypothetical protein